MKRISRGFTIVELAIVISVIAILATITIVTYSGVQDRANFTKAQSDLAHINDALTVYKARVGQYPVAKAQYASYEYSYFGGPNATFLSDLVRREVNGVVSSDIDAMPSVLQQKGDYTFNYAYRSDGQDYKLIRTGSPLLPSMEISAIPLASAGVENTKNAMRDPAQSRSNRAWGYWTAGGASW